MSPDETIIDSVSGLLAQLRHKRLHAANHHHLRWWFRGQPNADWDLRPGVYRDGFAPDEQARLTTERHLAQDFRVESAGIRSGRESDEELYFLQQHYRLPTRLLDWTRSPLAALYFAALSHGTGDGKVYMMDAYRLRPQVDETVRFRGIATSRDPTFKKSLHPILRWSDPIDFPTFILPVRPDYFDRRISLQKSCFTFHGPDHPVLTREHNHSLNEFRVPQSAKQEITQELFLLGIDKGSVYGDLEGLANRLKAAYGLNC